MGEPSFNWDNIKIYLLCYLKDDVSVFMDADVIHPVFTTMLPRTLGRNTLKRILGEFCQVKNCEFRGEAGLQLSINSTDEEQRNDLFRGLSVKAGWDVIVFVPSVEEDEDRITCGNAILSEH
nr:MAG TPA: hypothetical protein [Caudoviricetes sp.]